MYYNARVSNYIESLWSLLHHPFCSLLTRWRLNRETHLTKNSLSLSLSLFLARSFISAPSHAESAPNQKTRTPRERHTISGHCHGRIRMPTLRHSETSLRPVKIRLIPFFLLFYADACCRGRAAAVTEKSDDSSKRRYTRLRIQNTHTHARAHTHTHTCDIQI